MQTKGNQKRDGKKDDQAGKTVQAGLDDLGQDWGSNMTKQLWHQNTQKERQNHDTVFG